MKTWEQARDAYAILFVDDTYGDCAKSLSTSDVSEVSFKAGADWGKEWTLGSNYFELYKAERAKSAKLLEALEFYADSSSYDTTIERNGYTDPSEWDQIPPVICDDDGYIARDAIAAYKGEE